MASSEADDSVVTPPIDERARWDVEPGAAAVSASRRELELATHLSRSLEMFNPMRAWKIPGKTILAFDLTLDELGNLFGDALGLGGRVPSLFPDAVDLSPIVARALDFPGQDDQDDPGVIVVLTVRVSDYRSLVDLTRDKAGTAQILTAAMAYRDSMRSSGVRPKPMRFVLNFLSGSKARLEDIYFAVFFVPDRAHLHGALEDIIFGDDEETDAGRRALEVGRAAEEAAAFATAAEASINDNDEAHRAAEAAARLKSMSVGPRYDEARPWERVHGDVFRGVVEPVLAGNADVVSNSTYAFGRGFETFPVVLEELVGREARVDQKRAQRLMTSVAIVLTSWADRMPAGGRRADVLARDDSGRRLLLLGGGCHLSNRPEIVRVPSHGRRANPGRRSTGEGGTLARREARARFRELHRRRGARDDGMVHDDRLQVSDERGRGRARREIHERREKFHPRPPRRRRGG